MSKSKQSAWLNLKVETPWKRKLRFHFQTKSLRYPQLSIRGNSGKQYAFFSEKKFSLALTPGVSHSLSLTLALTCRSRLLGGFWGHWKCEIWHWPTTLRWPVDDLTLTDQMSNSSAGYRLLDSNKQQVRPTTGTPVTAEVYMFTWTMSGVVFSVAPTGLTIWFSASCMW